MREADGDVDASDGAEARSDAETAAAGALTAGCGAQSPKHGSDFPRGVLRPAVRPGERFAFSMCNPPFFETIEQAGLNPHTAHAGAQPLHWR